MSRLFSPIRFRELTIRNRVFVSPMCQYSSEDGMPTDWHLVHLGARAAGGAGLVMQEATAVTPDGRISPQDAGIWSDAHAAAYRRIAAFIASQGAVPAIQLAHAGRKASTVRPWDGAGDGAVPAGQGNWQPIGPGPEPFADHYTKPREMTSADADTLVAQFAAAARRAWDAGFKVAEVHAAHGYLLHSFLSPLSNHRTDEYGGSFDNRARLTLRITEAVRAAWPADMPVFVRLSCTDWVEGGWDLSQTIELAKRLRDVGVDLIDCSSGGNTPRAKIPVGPDYQVPFAEAVRKEAGVATGAVGMITDAKQAEAVVADGRADAVLLARELLRDPHWPLRAAAELGAEVRWPVQYERAARRR
jgi:2,4-dienoyl-CoA reductase-like NADH-dependent reductase (Old Yellow Enzyme family)